LGEGLFNLEVSLLNILSFVLIAIGSIMVYGAKYILKFLKIEHDEVKFIIFKLIGLIIAVIGFFRVLDII
jgi:lipid-A-disaccharide synthase-like uncharacterized protein